MSERITVKEGDTEQTSAGLFLSARATFSNRCHLVVGRTGLANVEATLFLGDTLTFETFDDGDFEIRMMKGSNISADLLVTPIKGSGFDPIQVTVIDPSNAPFTPDERVRIAESLKLVREELAQRSDIQEDKLLYISRKLHELEVSSERIGRKDWKLLVLGTLVSMAAESELAVSTFHVVYGATSSALSWLSTTGLPALPFLSGP